MIRPSAVRTRRGASNVVTIAVSLAVIFPLFGCERSYPELEGTYPGRFGINRWTESHGGTRILVCGGPGVINITSTEGGVIAGSWDFGPDTVVADVGQVTCGEGWHYAGELGGWVRGESEVFLSFHYLGDDFLPAVFDAVFDGGAANAWPASTKAGGLMLALNWHDCPGSPGEHWCVSFHAWRQ